MVVRSEVQMGVTRGEPDHLRGTTDVMAASTSRLTWPIVAYRTAVARLLAADSEMPIALTDRSARLDADQRLLEAVDRQPALFAMALQLADRLDAMPDGGPAWLRAYHDSMIRRLLDPMIAAEQHARGEQLALELERLTSDGIELDADDDRLASLLAELGDGDAFLVAGFYGSVSPDAFADLLTATLEANDLPESNRRPNASQPATRDPITELLVPLSRSFERAAHLDAFAPGFIEELTAPARTSSDRYLSPGRVPELTQLLVFGDLLRTGNDAVTSAFAGMLLHESYRSMTGVLTYGDSSFAVNVWHATGREFNPDDHILEVAAVLADDPALAYTFLTDPDHQRTILRTRGSGHQWPDGSADLPARIIEAGLLVHPDAMGWFDRDRGQAMDPAFASVLDPFLRQVAAEPLVHADVAPSLMNGLSPHLDVVLAAASEARTDVVGPPGGPVMTRQQLVDYLTNVVAHPQGEQMAQAVFTDWSVLVVLDAAAPIADMTGELPRFAGDDFAVAMEGLNSLGIRLTDALAAAGRDHEERYRFALSVVDGATGVASSRLSDLVGATGGPVGWAGKQAVSRSIEAGGNRLQDSIMSGAPQDAVEHDQYLSWAMPRVAVQVVSDAYPDTVVVEPTIERGFGLLVPISVEATMSQLSDTEIAAWTLENTEAGGHPMYQLIWDRTYAIFDTPGAR